MATDDTPGAQPVLPRPLFTLDTLTPNDHILVDGKAYDLLRPEQLSIVGFHELSTLCPRFDVLMKAATLTKAEKIELQGILVRVIEHILKAPDDVKARLTDQQKLTLVLAFTGLSWLLPAATRARATAAPLPPRVPDRSTGPKRSRRSSGSTRARRRPRG